MYLSMLWYCSLVVKLLYMLPYTIMLFYAEIHFCIFYIHLQVSNACSISVITSNYLFIFYGFSWFIVLKDSLVCNESLRLSYDCFSISLSSCGLFCDIYYLLCDPNELMCLVVTLNQQSFSYNCMCDYFHSVLC